MEILNSFFSNIKDKLTNPFFGTLLIVLIIDHWQLWYGVFHFDADCTMDDKLYYIRNYASNHLTGVDFLLDILQAVFYMFAGYLIIVGTRSLVMWIEFWLMPVITRKVVNKNVIRRSEYDEVVKEREEYFDQYEEQRKNVRNFSKIIDEQTEQIKLKDSAFLNQSVTIDGLAADKTRLTKQYNSELTTSNQKTDQIKQLEETNKNLNKELDFQNLVVKGYENIFFGKAEKSYSSFNQFPPAVIDKAYELIRHDKWKTFLAFGNFSENGGSLGGKTISEMIERNIAFDRDKPRISLTPIGKILWKYKEIFEKMI